MARSQTRAIFLDAGNTLFTERRPRAAIYATVARAHGSRMSDADVADEMTRAHTDLPASFDGCFRYSLAWFRAFNDRVLTACGVSARRMPHANEILMNRFQDPRTFRVFEEVPEVLAALAGRGVFIGVVSNWSENLPDLCKSLGIAEHLRFIITSAELRSEKPDRAIFERALFRAGVPAEETLHVGDNFDRDVCGALSAGMRAAWLDRRGSTEAETRDGVPVLRNLSGLPALLESAPAAADPVAVAR
jgi:putative hydrolase of the HAD superfamily